MMSSTGQQKRSLVGAIRHLWAVGGVRAYYRGLSVRASYRGKILTYGDLGRVDWFSRRFPVRRAIHLKLLLTDILFTDTQLSI